MCIVLHDCANIASYPAVSVDDLLQESLTIYTALYNRIKTSTILLLLYRPQFSLGKSPLTWTRDEFSYFEPLPLFLPFPPVEVEVLSAIACSTCFS